MASRMYTLDSGAHGRYEEGAVVTYKRGDPIEVSDEEAQGSLKGRITPLHSAEEVAAVKATKDNEWAHVRKLTVKDVLEVLDGLVVDDDHNSIEMIRQAEKAGKSRPGIMNYIEALELG